MPSTAIIGAGALGGSLATHLRSKGCSVLLAGTANHPGMIPEVNAHQNKIKSNGTEYSVQTGGVTQAATKDHIFITVPSSGWEGVINSLARFDLNGKTLIVVPGGGFTAMLLAKWPQNKQKPYRIMELDTSPYAVRRGNGNIISIKDTKKTIAAACALTPASDNFKQIAAQFFPLELEWLGSPMEILMRRTGLPSHALASLAYQTQIDANQQPYFYRTCVSHVTPQIATLEAEIRAICQAWGISFEPLLSITNKRYGTNDSTFKELVETLPAYYQIRAPKGPLKNHRYVQEDMKGIAVLYFQLAQKAGVNTPTLRYIIERGSALADEDFMRTGWRLSEFGIGSNWEMHHIKGRLNGSI
ncbi:MAG: NAD/NADP octopine/nopaline dehydrogenase family protein [Rhodobacteraceae bacterium]|nr:NAD/NADP octopine/nopaline dehydrogenase family protein [Paracoccaceae bacterium]